MQQLEQPQISDRKAKVFEEKEDKDEDEGILMQQLEQLELLEISDRKAIAFEEEENEEDEIKELVADMNLEEALRACEEEGVVVPPDFEDNLPALQQLLLAQLLPHGWGGGDGATE